MYKIEVQNEQGEWELKLTCSEGLVDSHVDLYKSMYKRDVRVLSLSPDWAKSVPITIKRDVDLSSFFENDRIRGLSSIRDATGLTPEMIVEWVNDQGGDVYSSRHKGTDRLFCRMPETQTENVIPNIFDIY